MKKYLTLLFLVISHFVKAQLNCGASVPVFTVDLTGVPDSQWVSTPIQRQDNCCGSSFPDRCVGFVITLDSDAIGLIFDIAAGARPSGSLYYQINCGPQHVVGDAICLSGPGPYYLTFCKPGSNLNQYSITSIKGPTQVPDVLVGYNCASAIGASGFLHNSLTWNSISPGTPGQYNSVLSCTACDTATVTNRSALPDSVIFRVCGQPSTSCSPATVCDTVTVRFGRQLSVTITPDSPILCYTDTFAMLTAAASGGAAPYRYRWSSGDTTATVRLRPGTYRVTVTDQISCLAAYDTVTVVQRPRTYATTITRSVDTCSDVMAISLSATSSTGSLMWSGGQGTFAPSATASSVVYHPTASEQASGMVRLIVSPTNTFSCPATADSAVIRFHPRSFTVSPSITQVSCYNGTDGAIATSVSGTSSPYRYIWSNTSTGSSLSGLAAGSYAVTVTDAIGCKDTLAVTLVNPTQVTATASVSINVSCYGGNNGAANSTASGGTAPYTYAWSNGATTANISGLTDCRNVGHILCKAYTVWQ